MREQISHSDLAHFKKLSYITYFFSFLPLTLVLIGSFFSPPFIVFVLFLCIPTFINLRYLIHLLKTVSVEMDDEAFYFEKEKIEYKIPFKQVTKIQNKRMAVKKWRKVFYYMEINYVNKHLQKQTIYFLSTDQQENYTWNNFLSKENIPFVHYLQEHINNNL